MKCFTRKLDPALQALMSRANVHRIGKGIKWQNGHSTGEVAWIITVTQKLPEAELSPQDIVPQVFKGLPTDVRVRRIAQALKVATLAPRTDKWRPAPGGVSIGHYQITAGTLGVVVYKDGNPYILSNNHVLANCNEGTIGDPILQPGAHDGGQLNRDEIGKLYDFIPFEFQDSLCPFASAFVKACNFLLKVAGRHTRLVATRQAEANLVDCALAKPDYAIDVSDEILEIGVIFGYIDPRLGLEVKKSGRTTGLTKGTIREIDVTANVNMGDGKMATFTDCFATEDISDPGDSGSLAVAGDRAVGLLFAGSDLDTIYCSFRNVKEALGLD